MALFDIKKAVFMGGGDNVLTAEGNPAVSHLLKVFSEEPHGGEMLILQTGDGHEVWLYFKAGSKVLAIVTHEEG